MAALEVPLGLTEYTATELIQSESLDGAEWDTFHTTKLYTNAFVLNAERTQILLGLKKRGFGVNLFNGFGGKVELGESPLEAAKRELKEEAGIDAPLAQCGLLFFKSVNMDFAHKIYIFQADEYSGTVTESEEMRPQWFTIGADTSENGIPFEKMWADDRLWLPLLIGKIPFVGRVDFGISPTGDKTGVDAPMTRTWFAKVKGF